MKKTLFFALFFLCGAAFATLVCTTYDCRGALYSFRIDSFDQCAEAGFPVVATDPPRCYLSEERVFVRPPEHIRIFEPEANTVVSSPLQISGEARVINNTVQYELVDEQGQVLQSGSTTTDSLKHGQWGMFSAEVSFAFPEAQTTGVLKVFESTPRGTRLSMQNMPIRFQDVEETNNASEHSQEVDSEVLVSESSDFDPLQNMTQEALPTMTQLEVPFTPQAPFANWDPPFDEACEEASLLMVEYYLQGKSLSANDANSDIILLTDWQQQNGYAIDISAQEVLDVARQYYDREGIVYTGEEVTTENIQKLLTAGYPVIIPAAGQDLGNPYFRGAGPPYHMLVITGYDEQYFYTNDPGTRRGKGFRYEKQLLVDAIYDWTGNKDTIRQGQKAMLIIE